MAVASSTVAMVVAAPDSAAARNAVLSKSTASARLRSASAISASPARAAAFMCLNGFGRLSSWRSAASYLARAPTRSPVNRARSALIVWSQLSSWPIRSAIFQARSRSLHHQVNGSTLVGHYTSRYKSFDGLLVATRRRVFRRNPDNTVNLNLPSITLDIHDVELVRSGDGQASP